MNKEAIILHLESATKVCSVSVSKGEQLIGLKETAEGNRHSQWMTTFIEELLAELSLGVKDLDAISVSEGPGSYTGLRVAYSVAKGMAYALNIPMIAVDTLQSLSNAYLLDPKYNPNTQSFVVLPMIDARRMEVYTLAVDQNRNIVTEIHPHILENDSLSIYSTYDSIVLVGDGAVKVQNLELPSFIQDKVVYQSEIACSAAYLRYEAYDKWCRGEFLDVAYCVPKYLKSPNITTSKKKMLG